MIGRLKNSGIIGENNANSGDLARLSPYSAERSRGLRGVGFPIHPDLRQCTDILSALDLICCPWNEIS